MGWKKNESLSTSSTSFKECFTILLRDYKDNHDCYFNTDNYDEIEAEINFLKNDDDMYKPLFTSVEIVDKDGVKIPYSTEERLHHLKSAIKNMKDDATFVMSDVEMPPKYFYYTYSYIKILTIFCLLLILFMKNIKLKLFFLTLLFFMYFFL